MIPTDLQKKYNQVYRDIKNRKELWEMFTDKEAYPPTTLDEHQRFLYAFSQKHDVLHPQVSEYLLSKGYKFNYPDEKSWVLLLTHDVDDLEVLNKHLLISLSYLPRNGDLRGMYNLLKGRLNPRSSPYKNFKRIIDLEQQYNATSTFFFLSAPEDIFGRKYTLEETKDTLGFLIDKGCEIGFHTNYYSYDDVEKIKTEKASMESIVGRPIIGVRNHVLRFQLPQSWEILAKAGFSYDSTYGYADMIGFRNGMCHPFVPYNRLSDQPIDILEIPLNLQDWTIGFVMKNNPEQTWFHAKHLLNSVQKNHGVLNILWHNWTFSYPTSIGTVFGKQWTKLYEKILAYASDHNAWITNCKDFYSYYQNHEFIIRV